MSKRSRLSKNVGQVRKRRLAKRESTGFNDKNGKKIYNGTILNNHGWLNIVIKEDGLWKVKYAGGTELLKNQKRPEIYKDVHIDAEVVGHIDDNPELLKGFG